MEDERQAAGAGGVVEFGATLPFRSIPGFAREAEELGYNYLTSGEHVAFYGPQANAFISLSVAAGATERIKLLSSVTLLPLYPAALAAKMAAMLDVASGGRFNLGVGIGGEYPAEFEACGVPVNQRASRTDEGLALLTRLLSGECVSFRGRYNQVSGISINPAPIQQPRPPIWVAGRKEPAMRRAARYADAWLPYMYTPEQLARSIDIIGRFLVEEERAAQSVRPGLFTFVSVDRDGLKARRQAIDIVGSIYQQDFSRLVDRYVIAGTPADCRRRVAQYAQAGATAIMTNLACSDEEKPEMLRLFAEEVMPQFEVPAALAAARNVDG